MKYIQKLQVKIARQLQINRCLIPLLEKHLFSRITEPIHVFQDSVSRVWNLASNYLSILRKLIIFLVHYLVTC